MKIIFVVGARPNFMKIAPFIKAIETYNHIFKSDDNLQPETRNPELLPSPTHSYLPLTTILFPMTVSCSIAGLPTICR